MFGKNGKTRPKPEGDPSSIGNLAIELGYITPDELKEAVSVQQQRLPLGQILVDMGKLTTAQLEDLLVEQRIRRGEIRDKNVIAHHEKARMRTKMGQIKEGFRELGEDTRRFSNSLLNSMQTMRVRVK